MEVQVRMLQDCETCIRTCSARHAVGLRIVARGRQVLAGRARLLVARADGAKETRWTNLTYVGASHVGVLACGKSALKSQQCRVR